MSTTTWVIVEPGLIADTESGFSILLKKQKFQPLYMGKPFCPAAETLGYAKLLCDNRKKELAEMGIEA